MRNVHHIRISAVALATGLLCLTFVAQAQARWNWRMYSQYRTCRAVSTPSVPPPAPTASPRPSAQQAYSAFYGSYDNNGTVPPAVVPAIAPVVAPAVAPITELIGGSETYNSGYNAWGDEH